MICFERYSYVIILVFFLIINPSLLHADPVKPLISLPASPVLINPQRAVPLFAPASRYSSRVISEDTLWRGAIQVDGMVTVAAQATLTILPGTIVRFGADSGILVLGRVVATGSPELPIILSSQYLEPAPSDWYGIVLTGTGKKNILEHLKIHGAEAAIYARFSSFELKHLTIDSSLVAIKLLDSIAGIKNVAVTGCSTGLFALKSEVDMESVAIEKGETAISVKSSSLTATNLTISSSLRAAFVSEKSQLKIERSVFSGNLDGATVIESEGSFNSSRFIRNSGTAISLSGSLLRFSTNLVSGNKTGMQLDDNLPSVWGNSIYGNSSYNLLYLGDEKLYVGGNWFESSNSELLNVFSKHPGFIQTAPLLMADPLIGLRKDF